MRRRRGARIEEGKGEGGTAAPGWTCKGQKKRTKIVKSNAENFSLTAGDAGDTEEGGGQCKNGRASERGERREREATVKSASSSHLEKQNPFRAPHYLFANEEKGRWAGGLGQALLPPFYSSIRSSVKRSDKKSTRPEAGEAERDRGKGAEGGMVRARFCFASIATGTPICHVPFPHRNACRCRPRPAAPYLCSRAARGPLCR